MTIDASLKSFYTLLLESATKKTQKLIFLAKSSCIVKMFAKKYPKNDKIYIFEQPLTMPFQICKNFKAKF